MLSCTLLAHLGCCPLKVPIKRGGLGQTPGAALARRLRAATVWPPAARSEDDEEYEDDEVERSDGEIIQPGRSLGCLHKT